MTNHFILKCRDEELLAFELSHDYFGTPELNLGTWEERRIPLSLALCARCRTTASMRRRYVGHDLHLDDVGGMCAVSLGLSLNDSYWTPREGDTRRFSDVNLYRNEFSSALASVAYTGHNEDSVSPHGLTPELTTDGTLHKAWRIDDTGSRVLYKGASSGWDPGEPLCELIASHIARTANLNSVRYGVDTWHGETCSVCRCFCSETLSYAPFARATGITNLGGALAFCARLGEEQFEALRDMIAFDCLIMNKDRHFSNFGLLRSPATGEAVGLPPIFDNGRGLFPMVPTEDLADAKYEAAASAPAFGASTFDVLAQRIMGPRQHGWLRGLANIDLSPLAAEYEGTPFHGEIAARYRGLEGFLQERSRELARLEPMSLDEMKPMLERAWEVEENRREGENLCPAERIRLREERGDGKQKPAPVTAAAQIWQRGGAKTGVSLRARRR